MSETQIPVFDGHNDTVMDLLKGRNFYERSESGHIDRPRAKEGGLIGGFFAVFVPDPAMARDHGVEFDAEKLVGKGARGVELVSETGGPSQAFSLQYTVAAIAKLMRVESGEGFPEDREPEDGELLTFVTTAEELEANIESDQFTGILHFEGAEMIDENFYALETFWHAGLRSIGPVWSRSNIFGHGVPFQFGATPDTGPGLTDLGKELIVNCNDLGIMIDCSHMNEKGFWDIAEITDAPLVCTHSNAWEVANATRNLTDKQLEAVAESGGVVGLNYHCGFVRPDGKMDSATPLSMFADHVDYLVDKLSIDGVVLGSDFDGALMPDDMKDSSMQQNLINELRGRGYDDAALQKIGYKNWVRVLRDTWGL